MTVALNGIDPSIAEQIVLARRSAAALAAHLPNGGGPRISMPTIPSAGIKTALTVFILVNQGQEGT
jgi:hypothetical protein